MRPARRAKAAGAAPSPHKGAGGAFLGHTGDSEAGPAPACAQAAGPGPFRQARFGWQGGGVLAGNRAPRRSAGAA